VRSPRVAGGGRVARRATVRGARAKAGATAVARSAARPGLRPSAMAVLLAAAAFAAPARPPNILFLIADDLGWGDTGCYGATKIRTPRIDRLAAEGVRFTDAHSTGAVCNPSRYSILSGTHLCHAKRRNDYSLYFHEGQVTLPALLKSAGYRTAALGKWHNGFGRDGDPDWNAELRPGPMEIGFDSFFGTPKTHNEPPLVYVDGHRIVGLDPADPIRIDKTKGPHGEMLGGARAAAARPGDRIDFVMAEKAAAFLAAQPTDRPFFLYVAFAAPHVPINPAPEFRGTSGVGLYGDFIQQLDHCTGIVLDALEKAGLAQDTFVVFTSDNGAVVTREAVEAGHRTNASLLGQKTDAWEGGHRVPFIARWPGRIPAGSERKALFTQVDLMATFAEAAGIALPAGASPDGASDLAAFLDPAGAPAERRETIFLGTGGTALRQDEWIYLPKQGSCGMTVQVPEGKPWGLPWPKMGQSTGDIGPDGRPLPGAPAAQLYNLASDRNQTTNVISAHPGRAAAMEKRLKEIIRPGSGGGGQTGVPAPRSAPAAAVGQAHLPAPLKVQDGRFVRDGRPYRGVGVNYFDLFIRVLNAPTNTESLAGLKALGESGIPFARFSLGYGTKDLKRYFDDPAAYLAALDTVVRCAETNRVGLIPSMFWTFKEFPDLAGEPRDQWGNPDSETHRRMRRLVADVVQRYRASPAIWGWELGNEPNLAADLPNAAQFRKKGGTERDDVRSKDMVVMLAGFAKEVRRHDPERPVFAGHSHPRASAWHNTAENSWKPDSREQTLEIIRRDNPEPLDTHSLHVYATHDVTKELAGWATNHVDYLGPVVAQARALKRPVWIGEFGLPYKGDEEEIRAKFVGLIDAMERTGVDLAAVWVFDLANQPDWTLTFGGPRAGLLRLVAEANRRWNEAAGASR